MAGPQFTKSPPELVERFDAAAARHPDAQRRKMFGYPALFVGGNLATGLFADTWMVRLGPADLEALVALPGAGAVLADAGPDDARLRDPAPRRGRRRRRARRLAREGDRVRGEPARPRRSGVPDQNPPDRASDFRDRPRSPILTRRPSEGRQGGTATRSSPLRISAKVWSRKPSLTQGEGHHDHRQDPDLQRLRPGVHVHCQRAGLLRGARVHRAAPLRIVPGEPQGRAQRRAAAVARTAPAAGTARGGGGGYGSRGPREMFPATCSSCGQETEVPFKPTSGKPVYCSACFAQRRA